jgi:outer membrane phospholipase A
MADIIKSLILFCLLLACAVVRTADVFAQAELLPASSQTDNGKRQENDKKDCDKRSPISIYKINYFALNSLPNNTNAQLKFQFSVKYKFFNRDVSVGGRPLSLYLAYSQKSLWNVGQDSMPFEESNYNPEAFFNYSANITWGPVALRDIILSPYEHESNGLAGPQSRSWNRLYAAARLGFFPILEQCHDNFAPKDHIELTLKIWHAYEYSDQTAYLRTIGSNNSFLDYEGYGEVNVALRDILAGGDWGNQIDMTSKISRKRNFVLQYRQKIPPLNFIPYIQYSYGYDETLLRFDRFGKRTFWGVSFVY